MAVGLSSWEINTYYVHFLHNLDSYICKGCFRSGELGQETRRSFYTCFGFLAYLPQNSLCRNLRFKDIFPGCNCFNCLNNLALHKHRSEPYLNIIRNEINGDGQEHQRQITWGEKQQWISCCRRSVAKKTIIKIQIPERHWLKNILLKRKKNIDFSQHSTY